VESVCCNRLQHRASGAGLFAPKDYEDRGDDAMKLTEPKVLTFGIAVLLGLLGILGFLVPTIPAIGGVFSVWLIIIGFVLLALANLLKGL
jgi:hypothetical protein